MVEAFEAKVVDAFKKDFGGALLASGAVGSLGEIEDKESGSQVWRGTDDDGSLQSDGENLEIVKGRPVPEMMDEEFTARDGRKDVGGNGLAGCGFWRGHL
jgi:hypothetical protein